MTVLVTGGAGYIGGHMVLGLLDAGEEPVVIDDMSNGVPWAIPNGVRFVLGDSGDYETVARTIAKYDVDAVVHFAARLITPQYYDDPLEYYHANTVKSRTLLSAVQNLGVKHFIFSSTAAVYGNPPINPVPETAPLAPISVNPPPRLRCWCRSPPRSRSASGHSSRSTATTIPLRTALAYVTTSTSAISWMRISPRFITCVTQVTIWSPIAAMDVDTRSSRCST